MTHLNWKYIGIGAGALAFLVLVWFMFFRSGASLSPAETPVGALGVGESRVSVGVDSGTENSAEGEGISSSAQKVFRISTGPVAGASFVRELRPTTTLARFVMQHNGHVFDLVLDSPGAVARLVSNTTIPGIARVAWIGERTGAALQYADTSVKTALLIFPTAATTSTSSAPQSSAVRIQFLPQNLLALTASPDGTQLAYLVATAAGTDGYLTRADGTGARKLFSLPVSQVVLSWPAAQNLLVTTKAAAGVAGIAFSVNTASGAVSPILYSPGLTTTADRTFAHVVYQTASTQARATYAHDVSSNADRPLSFDPMPEKCAWSKVQESVMYCAMPLALLPGDYPDAWRKGAASLADAVFSYSLITGETKLLALPGGIDGGESADIAELGVSPDDKYLLFIKKGERSLWGVRLY